jgi:hypothetical protein
MSMTQAARRTVRAHRLIVSMIASGALPLLPNAAGAEVTSVGDSGFELREQVHVAAAPAMVYAALLAPRRWWDPKHTYSGDAARLTLEPKVGGCWCETIPGGGAVQHMTVIYLAPNKAVRLRGALGPLQAMGVAGSLTITLAGAGTGTDLTFDYAIGGYAKDGFGNLSKGVDAVLGSQATRLKMVVETGAAQSPTS